MTNNYNFRSWQISITKICYQSIQLLYINASLFIQLQTIEEKYSTKVQALEDKTASLISSKQGIDAILKTSKVSCLRGLDAFINFRIVHFYVLCIIHPSSSSGENQVRISWKSGENQVKIMIRWESSIRYWISDILMLIGNVSLTHCAFYLH